PLSVMIESPMVWPAVNLASLLVVPPGVVTPPPTPLQLPAVVQTSLPLTLAPVALTLKYLVVPALSVTANKSTPKGLAASWIVKPVLAKWKELLPENVWLALSRATFALKRASFRVPDDTFETLSDVSPAP